MSCCPRPHVYSSSVHLFDLSCLPSSCSWPFLEQDQLESVLEVLHRQTEQYQDQPQHLEKITCQQRLLQEDLVHIRAELCRESTVWRG